MNRRGARIVSHLASFSANAKGLVLQVYPTSDDEIIKCEVRLEADRISSFFIWLRWRVRFAMVDHVMLMLLMMGAWHLFDVAKCHVIHWEEQAEPPRGHVGDGASRRLSVGVGQVFAFARQWRRGAGSPDEDG